MTYGGAAHRTRTQKGRAGEDWFERASGASNQKRAYSLEGSGRLDRFSGRSLGQGSDLPAMSMVAVGVIGRSGQTLFSRRLSPGGDDRKGMMGATHNQGRLGSGDEEGSFARSMAVCPDITRSRDVRVGSVARSKSDFHPVWGRGVSRDESARVTGGWVRAGG